MKITLPNRDYITISETEEHIELDVPKVHLIKLDFQEPTYQKVYDVLYRFPSTNRYVIDDNVKLYNDAFKGKNKKFYVENKQEVGLISFFRKNNKVLLNINNLNSLEWDFVIGNLRDILRNIEVIQMTHKCFDSNFNVLNSWNGNVIITDIN